MCLQVFIAIVTISLLSCYPCLNQQYDKMTIETFVSFIHWYIITQIIVSTMIYWMLHT